MIRALAMALVLLLATSAQAFDLVGGTLTGGKGNDHSAPVVVWLVWDDLGTVQDPNYGASGAGVSTNVPGLDRLASDGARFTNFYANPVCATTRASLVFGQYNFRTAVYGGPAGSWPYSRDSSIGTVLSTAGAGAFSFAAGKYGGAGDSSYPRYGPALDDFDQFNMDSSVTPTDFSSWTRYYGDQADLAAAPGDGTANPNSEAMTVFMDTYSVDSAIQVYRNRDKDVPLLLYVGLHAIHVTASGTYDPTQSPPHTNTSCLTSDDICFERMAEQMDADTLRMLDAIDPQSTYVFAFSDNGDDRNVSCKSNLTECGTRVPAYVIGPGVSAGTFTDRAHVVDIWATTADILRTASYAGASVVDGYSFADQIGWSTGLSGRAWASRHGHQVILDSMPLGVGDRAFWDDTYPDYKLIRNFTTGAVSFYDISAYNAGTGAEPTDICGGDGTCLGNLDPTQTTAFNGMCAELTTYEGGGAACPAP